MDQFQFSWICKELFCAGSTETEIIADRDEEETAGTVIPGEEMDTADSTAEIPVTDLEAEGPKENSMEVP